LDFFREEDVFSGDAVYAEDRREELLLLLLLLEGEFSSLLFRLLVLEVAWVRVFSAVRGS
tara:strand:- start:210 stop:389 length:180 start_codon:yes stop_codon:yes gene_type:complete